MSSKRSTRNMTRWAVGRHPQVNSPGWSQVVTYLPKMHIWVFGTYAEAEAALPEAERQWRQEEADLVAKGWPPSSAATFAVHQTF